MFHLNKYFEKQPCSDDPSWLRRVNKVLLSIPNIMFIVFSHLSPIEVADHTADWDPNDRRDQNDCANYIIS